MSIEKVYLPKQAKIVKDESTGEEKTEVTEPWEIRATGKDCQELKGMLRPQAEKDFHDSLMADIKIGMETVTDPFGRVDRIRSDKVEMARQHGYCRYATKPMVMVNGFSDRPSGSARRMRIRYGKQGREVLYDKEY